MGAVAGTMSIFMVMGDITIISLDMVKASFHNEADPYLFR
ncbi:hypothetical protein NUITMVP1_15640 [Proteus mirabilis]|nr:hypothetical protein BB2000_1097 [Proteus mirabilis BB2000]AWF40873.1 hypothetical protein CSC16_1605 [Proteus mirabilis]KXB98920.1 hypothetical protein HMPREF3203_03644 [Proteus mirabilis]PVF84709.1 hypothetical protein CSC14_4178 [Proteus mirabilis]BDR97655.1 hypothetical protein NUITMVP1_15640 [Proteus mirabilis]